MSRIEELSKSKKNTIRLIICLLLLLGISLFLISQIKLEKDRDRNVSNCVLTSDLRNQVMEVSNNSHTPQDIIKKCSNLACETLSFTANNDLQRGKANCVGYAQLTSAIINYAFQAKKLPYRAKPVVGKVYLFGIELNNVAQKILPEKHRSFFKDHDFVEVDLGDFTVYIDSSLQDLTCYRFYQTKCNK